MIFLLLLAAALVGEAANAENSTAHLTTWQQGVEALGKGNVESSVAVDAILRHYPGSYCDAIQDRPSRMQCVAARMGQEAARILDKHKSMRSRIGWTGYAALWTDPSTGIRDEFRRAGHLLSGGFSLGLQACMVAATSEEEQWSCLDRVKEAKAETCLAQAESEQERQVCREERESWERLKEARSAQSSGPKGD